ncbi:phosphatidylinositol glycan, class M [Babesia microti strain RI]|uniref:GPI mannosyltransferase 1 n=1 Tax=Babesia microti (strain RI) TaxID=1133968 RepID=A0A1R4AAV5_BABMR|nr:phosphatidylinositol glycan, class M [Babesia microti strain RI]SJK86136.1 phosphatidylinositol glycan, class M [Babesia microti strain RI]|eukprot:XP_021338330.1 phosphatidylinositol glycan, class M [Babesia microti strain RI]
MLYQIKCLFYEHTFALALVLRFLLVAYGRIHDSLFKLKYTDIDYKVFTDAASFVYKGESPYLRETYRYTPLIAFLLIPNVTLCKDFGKILFSIFDILTGYFVHKILKFSKVPLSRSRILTAIYLFNPISIAISTRGNADCLICFVVMSAIYFHMKNRTILSSICLGFAIHLKLYPVIYLIPFFISLYKIPVTNNFVAKIRSNYSLYNILNSCMSLIWDSIYHLNINHVKFQVTLITTLTYLTLLFYNTYGYSFLYETYLYHFKRLDHRHNLSLYFYHIYHLVDKHQKLNFLVYPFFQLLCVVTCGLIVDDLILSMCLQTIMFIALNKVCTCQYFIWWISLLPLALAKAKLTQDDIKNLFYSGLLFILSLGLWLFFAYLLEFVGISTYIHLFASSIFFTYSQFNLAWKIYSICNNYSTVNNSTNNVEKGKLND